VVCGQPAEPPTRQANMLESQGASFQDPCSTAQHTSLKELALLFLKLGTVAFGGPAAHIAMMEDEIVRRRRWLSQEEFLDLLGATNLIPGPTLQRWLSILDIDRPGWRGCLWQKVASFFQPPLLSRFLLALTFDSASYQKPRGFCTASSQSSSEWFCRLFGSSDGQNEVLSPGRRDGHSPWVSQDP
jgi:hypothetical protein